MIDLSIIVQRHINVFNIDKKLIYFCHMAICFNALPESTLLSLCTIAPYYIICAHGF